MANSFDVIIIGSGFGGAVTACRLAEAGMKVLVLERGRRWGPKEAEGVTAFPREPGDRWLWDENAPHKLNGWLDLRIFGDMTVAQCAGVGGGSLIYANISIEPHRDLFDDGWPSDINYDELAPHYKTVHKMLGLSELPDNQLTERFQLMKAGAEKLGYGDRFRKVDMAVTFDEDWNYDLEDPFNDKHSKTWTNDQGRKQGTCVHCGNCDIGCQVGARNTLDLNYLAQAENKGAEIRPMHQVRHIDPVDGGYRVVFRRLDKDSDDEESETAAKVIIAAGSLGSTELLLRCRDQFKTLPNLSPRLGFNWSSNGDFLTPAFYNEKKTGISPSPTEGPTITCAIDFLDGKVGGERFFIEDGGFPNLLRNYLKAKRAKGGGTLGFILKHLGKLLDEDDPLSNVMPWFAQGIDAANGRFRLGRVAYAPWRRQLKLDWDIKKSQGVI
ncbi:GMC family oxidoreductase, partial [Candidatus Sumerlaeota bacterium]|nr:GMC family oxidoreductase [Candidatus Sumerlaeota bacterium]